jgi:hypothetical protein
MPEVSSLHNPPLQEGALVLNSSSFIFSENPAPPPNVDPSDPVASLKQGQLQIANTLQQITDVLKAVQISVGEIPLLASGIMDLKKKIDEHETKMSKLEEDHRTLLQKVDYLEGQNRRNNLIFKGITEKPRESWSQSEDVIRDLLKNVFKIKDVSIERCHRVGPLRPQNRHPRPIVVKFTFWKDRERILKRRGSLAGTNVFLEEDFTARIQRARFHLRAFSRTIVHPDSVRPILSYDKLLVGGVTYTYNDESGKVIQTTARGPRLTSSELPPRIIPSSTNGESLASGILGKDQLVVRQPLLPDPTSQQTPRPTNITVETDQRAPTQAPSSPLICFDSDSTSQQTVRPNTTEKIDKRTPTPPPRKRQPPNRFTPSQPSAVSNKRKVSSPQATETTKKPKPPTLKSRGSHAKTSRSGLAVQERTVTEPVNSNYSSSQDQFSCNSESEQECANTH